MSLHTKLIISFTVLLLVVIGAVGVVASQSIRSILTEQIDRDLHAYAQIGPRGQPPGADFEPDRSEPYYRAHADLLVSADGTVAFSQPSGFVNAPDSLPDVDALPEGAGPFDLPSVDGSLTYRAIVFRLSDGSMQIVAQPLRDVAEATASLVRTLLAAGVVVLLVGGVATWWTVRRSMRPVDHMVETAEAIAGGDLTRRVPETAAGTELGRLGDSLNEMLAHIEESLETERDAKERLRQFVADASHELRTPVTVIAGYAELNRKGGLETIESRDQAWSRIESESRRMHRLVEDLLLLARIDQTQPLQLGNVDMTAIVTGAVSDHQAIDPGRPVTVTAPDRLSIVGDAQRLTQVVASLLSNVRTHTPPGTGVHVELAEHPETVVLEVTDEGPGIAPQALSQVFMRFYRGDPSRSRKSGGSGLGLAIVKAIVEAHGGSVTAGNPEGHGARITVTLPRTGPSSGVIDELAEQAPLSSSDDPGGSQPAPSESTDRVGTLGT